MTDFSKEAIKARWWDGDPLEFVFFWGPGESKEPRACFNQWSSAPFYHNNFLFANAEQAMMAEKAWLFKDMGTLYQILECSQPRAVKALGRLVVGYDDAVWADRRLDAVVEINYAKFSQNHDLAYHLLNTGDAVLVEASPVDRIWGIGLKETDALALNPSQWRGLNLLGEALMIVRDRLRKELE